MLFPVSTMQIMTPELVIERSFLLYLSKSVAGFFHLYNAKVFDTIPLSMIHCLESYLYLSLAP